MKIKSIVVIVLPVISLVLSNTNLFGQAAIQLLVKDSVIFQKSKGYVYLKYEIINETSNGKALKMNYLFYILKPICNDGLCAGLYYEIINENNMCKELSRRQAEGKSYCYIDHKKKRLIWTKNINLHSLEYGRVKIDSTLNNECYLYLPALTKGKYRIKLKYSLSEDFLWYPEQYYSGYTESNQITLIVE